MPHYIAIIQHDADDKHLILHRVALPTVREKGFYRQTGTYNAFFHSDKDRNNFWALHPNTAKVNGFKSRKPTHQYWYYSMHWDEFVERENRWNQGEMSDLNLPRVEHASMWDFYKHIGYDYKTMKWEK